MNASKQSMTRRKAIEPTSKLGSVVGSGQTQTIPTYGLGGVRRRGCMSLIQVFMRNVGTYWLNAKEREGSRRRIFASTKVNQRGGAIRSSGEVTVMVNGAKELRYSVIVCCQPGNGRSNKR